MTADIVNLRRARKAKARDTHERTAAENRRLHGRSKGERLAERSERERTARQLDSHRREADDKDRP
jgi:hypothetical protein